MCFLTRRRSSPRNADDGFPAAQLFLLALVRVAEPIALTSILPYAWKMVSDFHVTSETNAPFFAGLLISAFSLAEACSGMYWGSLSDRIGRVPVLMIGITGTIASLVMVGFASNFWFALAGRILGGALNGNIGVVQSVVGELVQNPDHEPRAYAVMPFVWSIGTIIGPSIGGYFAEPAKNFPTLSNGPKVFVTFPYLLPNLICVSLLVMSLLMTCFLLEETHPKKCRNRCKEENDRVAASSSLLPTQGAVADSPADLTVESYGTFNSVEMERDEDWDDLSEGAWSEPPRSGKAFSKTVIMFVAALGIFTYHSMTYDHLLPIFLQDKRASVTIDSLSLQYSHLGGGLAIPIQTVGLLLSLNGILQLGIQAVVFPFLADFLGVWRLLLMVTVAHPLAYIVIPLLQLLPESLLYLGLFVCLSIRNLTAILAFPLLLIMIKEAAPEKSHLGKINGLAASVGAACRTVASPVSGLLYGLSIELHFTPLAWWASAFVALLGALQVPLLNRAANNCHSRVRTAARFCREQ